MTKPSQLYGRPWSEAEYIVVLDSYFVTKGQPRHENSPFVKELASLLGRTPSSIYMRMENFASVDPAEANHRRGLTKISPECRKVFKQWADNLGSLRQCAEVLR